MAKDLSNATGIGTDANFINGDLVDGVTVVESHIYQDIVQYFQKLMNLAGLTPNGDFDNEVNDYQFIEALKKYIESTDLTITSNNILTGSLAIKGRVANFYNPTTITLDATKIIYPASGSGNVFKIEATASFDELEYITNSSSNGDYILIHNIGSTYPVKIINGSGADSISTQTGKDVIVKRDTLILLQKDYTGTWLITASSKELLKDEYIDSASAQSFVNLRTKVIEIGDWDMDASDAVSVSHGLVASKILSVSVTILPDSAFTQTPSLLVEGLNASTTTPQGNIFIQENTILMQRLTGGSFDSTTYNETSFNRGWITITYIA